MAKFHYAWSELARGYESLWDHVYEDEANQNFELLVRRERDLSELATTDAPNDQVRMAYWQEQVFRQHSLVSA